MINRTVISTTSTNGSFTPALRKRPSLHHSDENGNCPPVRQKTWRLLSYEEQPAYLQYNCFIRGGYTGRQTERQCIRNLFRWTNETVNIWSHLISFLLLLGFLCYDNWWTIPEQRGEALDHFFISVGLLGFMVCVLSSTGYHTFRCCSPQHFDFWLSLDLAGVATAGLGLYIPTLHLLFSCFPTERLIYLSLASMLVLALIQCMLFRPLRPFRVLLGVALHIFGVIPTMHWCWLMGGVKGRFAQAFLPRLCTGYALMALNVGVYVSKLPERILNGQVDLLGHSHQLWHILLSIAICYWHNTVLILLHEKNVNPCP